MAAKLQVLSCDQIGQYNVKIAHLFSYFKREKLLEPHVEGDLGGGSVAKMKLKVAKNFSASW